MKKQYLCGLFLAASFSSHATYIDYRHEWLGDEHKQEDRIKMGHSLNNGIYFSIEGKWESKQGGFWDNLSSKGNEFELGYKYKLLDNLSITPSFALDSGERDTAYKFSVKSVYNWTDAFSSGLRLRYAVRDYEREYDPDRPSQHYWQANFYLGYRIYDVSFDYDFEYKFDTDYPALRGKEKDYVHNMTIAWRGNKTWVPYVELGYVSYDDGSYVKDGETYRDAWEMRYRVGITYNF